MEFLHTEMSNDRDCSYVVVFCCGNLIMYSEARRGKANRFGVDIVCARALSSSWSRAASAGLFTRDNKFVSRRILRAFALGSRPMPANVHVPLGPC